MEISNPTTTSGLYLGDYETNNEYDPINHSVFEPNHISNQNGCFNQSNYNDTVELNNNNDSILSPNNIVDNQILSIDAKANDTNSQELTSNDKVVPYLVDTRNFLSESMYHIPNQSDNEIIQPDPISLPLQNYYSVSPYQSLQRQNSLPQPGSSSNYDGTINDYNINGSGSSLQLVIFNDDNDNNNNSNSNNSNNNDSAYKSDGNQNSPLIDPPTPPSQYLSQTPINQSSGGEPINSIRNPIDSNQHTIDPINSLQNQISNVSGISSTLKRRGSEFIDNQPTTSNYLHGPKYKDKKNNQQDGLLTKFVPYLLSHVGSEPPTKSLPRHIKPRIATTYWSDEKTVCYQVEAHGVLVSRREDTNYVNGTKLLNLAGMSRGKRDGILKSEKIKTVIKMGSMNLKGVWIPFERASEIARNEGLDDILFPLFVRDLKGYFERKGWSLKKDGLITATEDYSEFNN